MVWSAANGEPWKEDKSSLRSGKQDKPFNPRRSAYEMQSSGLVALKQARPWYKTVSADVLQQALRHLATAFNRFFQGKSGFPQTKSRNDFNSFEFKPKTVKVNGNHIVFPTLGDMRFFKSRDIPQSWEIRTVTVTREVNGWYASLLLRDDSIPDLPKKTIDELQSVNGVDRGIKKIAAMADGTVDPNPNIGKRFQRHLEIRQRRLSRKKKGSKNRFKAHQCVARLHQKIRRVRDDFQWKLARKIAASADVIGFEDLNIKGMKARCKPRKDPETGMFIQNGQAAKSALNKAISDASWYNLRVKTEHQANKLGHWVIDVPAHHTSQECSQCHYVSPGNRDGEKFVCENCGHHEDADVDAAVVIAQRTAQKLGIASLRVVSPKVTPKPELTGCKEISPTLVGEPGNQTGNRERVAVIVQMSLFEDVSGESPSIPLCG
ncbi:RNA-guided endonuclease InsQ/TnpB family protein [Neosynechococcus sphagnicola]|uniref:RNA-guided endonuclease InsQ/TnpB family protein n=1 Tax=Neosynechococcus sphagnicola TaxID=1501145 RepID=UPI00068E9DA0|nr:RNA-guided endonuclease TnpB family protein [Neosynechococcus sphagnicola]